MAIAYNNMIAIIFITGIVLGLYIGTQLETKINNRIK